MTTLTFKELLEAGAHFGHLRRKWNPKMAPYIFMEKNGIHVIDLNKTIVKLEEAKRAIKQIAKSGRKILFVATKKQAKDIIAETIGNVNMPYVTERWPGGMLTNFPTIRKAVKKMNAIDKMMQTPTFLGLSKRERLQVQRQRAKLEKNLGSISELNRLPSAIFVVDINKEHIAVHEARRLNIPIFAIVDTNTDPTIVDFPIPANDDAAESISIIVNNVAEAIKEGLEERRFEKEKNKQEGNDSKSKEPKTVKVASSKKEAISKEEKKEEPKKDNAE
jgi:small subunit ribosomal protein S2